MGYFFRILLGPPGAWCRSIAGRALGPAMLLAVLAGCASERAIPEFKLYLSTYNEASQSVSAVLGELEAVEFERARNHARRFGMTPLRWSKVPQERRVEVRKQQLERIRNNGGFDDQFHIEDSVYHATNSTPPITASFRRAFAAIGAYNAVLDAYAEGRALEEVEAELGGLAAAIGALGEALSISSGILGGALPGGQLVAAFDIVETALEAGSKEAFREAVIELEPKIDQTLSEMRAASPAIFQLLTARLRNEVKDANTPEAGEQAVDAIEKYRTVMSNWVVALDATEAALDRVVAAIRAPGTTVSLLSDLTATTANAASVAQQTRRLIGEIRTRP